MPTRSYFSNSDLASRGLPEGLEREILERYRGRVPPRAQDAALASEVPGSVSVLPVRV